MSTTHTAHVLFATALFLSCVAPHGSLVHSFLLPGGLSTKHSFVHKEHQPSPVVLSAGGGMGMGVATKKKKTKGGKKKAAKKSDSTPFDVRSSLLRMEKVYDEMSKADAKAMQSDEVSSDEKVLSEYVIAARAKNVKAVSDWVPVAQMAIARSYAEAHAVESIKSDDSIDAVLSNYCREIFFSATLGAPVFKTVPRNDLEYSAEPAQSFYKHVYDVVIEGKNDDAKNENVMTKAEARKMLQLDDEDANDMSAIKKSYRTLSFKLHPDRFVGQERTEDETKESSNEFARVKLAYETMSSGVRNADGKGMSWYESLGGRERTDFHGPIPLMSRDLAEELTTRKQIKSAVVALTPELVQSFVARNQMAQS